MQLAFEPSRLPRSMTRQEWREAYRWVRQTDRKLKQAVREQIDNLAAFGSTMPETIKQDMLDKLINPPLLVFPDAR